MYFMRPSRTRTVVVDCPEWSYSDLDSSFDFGLSETSYSAADYVPGSLENSPETSPNSTVRGTPGTGRRRFQCGADYFATPTPSLSKFNIRGHQYTASDASGITITPENFARHGHKYTASDASSITMTPENVARHGHQYTASDSSSFTETPEDDTDHRHAAPDPVTPMNVIQYYFGPSMDLENDVLPDFSSDAAIEYEYGYDGPPTVDFSDSVFTQVEGNVVFNWPAIPCRPGCVSLALPYSPPTRRPVFGPPIRTCRCCAPDTCPALLSAELAQEGEAMGPQLDALRNKLHLLISSMNMTVEVGGAKLLESMGTFLNLARVIVNEFDQIVTKFNVRWEHKLTPVPPPGPPQYFNRFRENEVMAGLPPGIAPASETVDDRDFCSFWQHCAQGFSGFRIGESKDVLIANDFVQLTFNHFKELRLRMRRGLYLRARLAVRDAKLAKERKDKKDVRRVVVIRRKKRIDEEETISDDTVKVEGDDAVQMKARKNQTTADADADEMRRRWACRQNANGGNGM